MLTFDYARNALRYLIRRYKIHELFIPYYLCDVIRHTIFEENCKPLFYHINDNFMPQISFPQNAFILYPNYFGICDKNIDKLIANYPKLIVDNAHAFYAPHKGFASFNSARKFIPNKMYAYLWLENEYKKNLQLDYERRKRFEFYHEIYSATNELNISLKNESIPFCYPYLAKDVFTADKVVKKLKSDNLTIYRYWNCLPESYNEYKFYSRLVPIPLS